jgi:hypothetical protein
MDPPIVYNDMPTLLVCVRFPASIPALLQLHTTKPTRGELA